MLATALRQMPDCRLVVIDPISSFIGGAVDAHRDNEVRNVLAPVGKLAEEHDVAILLVAHKRKAQGQFADDTVLGSRAFTGIVRSVWHLSAAPEDATRRLLLPGKSNLAKQATGLAFSITGDPVCLEWEPDPVEMNADELLVLETARPKRPSPALEEAMEFLRELLKNGPVSKPIVDEEAEGAGVLSLIHI